MSPASEGGVRAAEALRRARDFVRSGVWAAEVPRHRGARWFLLRQLQVFLLTVKGMREDKVRLRAASLTVISLLSTIPFLAVIFWVVQAVGGLEGLRDQLQTFIYENIAVGAQADAIEWINRFVGNIHTGAVGGIGTGVLLVASINLLASMETAFNEIWGLRRGRPLLNRFVIYWTLLTVGPILLAASLAGTAAIRGWLGEELLSYGLRRVLAVVPVFLTIGGFTLLYMVIPNTRVKLRHALVGGVVAGIFFELAKNVYAWLAANLFQYSAIYGSLGAVPVFIVWVSIVWLVILFGCELTFANQNVSTLRHEERARSASERERELLGVRLVLEIAVEFYRGGEPPTAVELAERLRVPSRLVRDLLTVLREDRIVLDTGSTYRVEVGHVPGRELAQLTVGQVVDALRERGERDLSSRADVRSNYLADVLDEAEASAREVYAELDFLSLARRFSDEGGDKPRDRVRGDTTPAASGP